MTLISKMQVNSSSWKAIGLNQNLSEPKMMLCDALCHHRGRCFLPMMVIGKYAEDHPDHVTSHTVWLQGSVWTASHQYQLPERTM